MLRQLIRWAEASPQWRVVIQRDHAWNDDEPWIPFYEPEDWTLPPNLGFGDPSQMLTLLSNCTACAGVSSPWLFTAMAWGRRAMVIGDFGIHSSQGTSGFFGCGAMHRLRQIHHLDQLLDLPKPSQSWLESMGWAVHDGPARLCRALPRCLQGSNVVPRLCRTRPFSVLEPFFQKCIFEVHPNTFSGPPGPPN